MPLRSVLTPLLYKKKKKKKKKEHSLTLIDEAFVPSSLRPSTVGSRGKGKTEGGKIIFPSCPSAWRMFVYPPLPLWVSLQRSFVVHRFLFSSCLFFHVRTSSIYYCALRSRLYRPIARMYRPCSTCSSPCSSSHDSPLPSGALWRISRGNDRQASRSPQRKELRETSMRVCICKKIKKSWLNHPICFALLPLLRQSIFFFSISRSSLSKLWQDSGRRRNRSRFLLQTNEPRSVSVIELTTTTTTSIQCCHLLLLLLTVPS